MKKLFFLISITTILPLIMFAQSVGIGTTTPKASAQLDVSSTTKGMLMPRLTTAQRKAISNPEPGLLVYDIDKKTIFIYGGIKWGKLVMSESEISEVFSKEISDAQIGDEFGNSVSLNGDYAVAGAYKDDVNGKIDQGSAFVFHQINGNWIQEAQLFSSDGLAGDLFGTSVSIHGNYIVVGAPHDQVGINPEQGSVYVFTRNGTNWTQQHKFSATDGAAGDHFGFSVSMSAINIVVGCPDDDIGTNSDQGSTTVFLLNGSIWAPEIKFTAADGSAGDKYGRVVSINLNQVLIGAPGDDNGSLGNGSVYIYFKAVNWGFIQKLLPSSGSSKYSFGDTFTIDGTTVAVLQKLVGPNPFEPMNSGRVFIYLRGTLGIWTLQTIIDDPYFVNFHIFGRSLSLSGDQLVIGTSVGITDFFGAAHVAIYKRTGTVWQEQSTTYNGNPDFNGDFGHAVSLNGFNVIIGAPFKNISKGQVSFLNIE